MKFLSFTLLMSLLFIAGLDYTKTTSLPSTPKQSKDGIANTPSGITAKTVLPVILSLQNSKRLSLSDEVDSSTSSDSAQDDVNN